MILYLLLLLSPRYLIQVLLQTSCFAAGACAAVTYLTAADSGPLRAAWAEVKALGGEAKFCVSLLIVALVYFGGAMYIAPPDMIDDSAAESGAGAAAMPASCDAQIGFVVPASLPANDKEFFQQRFYMCVPYRNCRHCCSPS